MLVTAEPTEDRTALAHNATAVLHYFYPRRFSILICNFSKLNHPAHRVENLVNCACKLALGNQILGLPDRLKPRFLSGLSKAELDSVLSVAKHRQFRASAVILHEEDPAERLFLLTSGHGRHFVITNAGRKVLLHWLTAGQIFGGAAILPTKFQYLANTEVLSDSCALLWERHDDPETDS